MPDPSSASPPAPPPALPPELRRALAEHTTLTLAYHHPDGPGACAVFCTWQPTETSASGRLLFLSSRRTRHGGALLADDRVGFTAQADGQHWATITGLQGRGRARVLGPGERPAAEAAYLGRFPFAAAEHRLAEAVLRAELWELVPHWLRFTDNTLGFGSRTEWGQPD